MAKKTKDYHIQELLWCIGLRLEYSVGVFCGRNVRYLESCKCLQVGEAHFDRWSNSIDKEFYLWQPSERRRFLRWASDFAEEQSDSA